MRSSSVAITKEPSAPEPAPPSRTRWIPGFEGLDPRVARALATQEIDSDEPEMESDIHRDLMVLLIELLRRWWQGRRDVYVSGNLSVFYALSQFDLTRPPKKSGQPRLARCRHRGPDVFVVFGAEPRPRKSWVVWQEGGKYPNVIIEILSPDTKTVDRGDKMRIYQDAFRTPEYFLFDPVKATLEGFRLDDGVYVSLAFGSDGRLRSEQMDLHLGVLEGELRLFTPSGEELLTTAEAEQQRAALADQQATAARQEVTAARQEATEARQQATEARQEATEARQEATEARQEATEARQEVERLAAKLRELGVDPGEVR